jgi:hypothetical protein
MRGMCYLEHGGQKPTCSIENCEKWSVRNGVCKAHYQDALSTGTPDYIRVQSEAMMLHSNLYNNLEELKDINF